MRKAHKFSDKTYFILLAHTNKRLLECLNLTQEEQDSILRQVLSVKHCQKQQCIKAWSKQANESAIYLESLTNWKTGNAWNHKCNSIINSDEMSSTLKADPTVIECSLIGTYQNCSVTVWQKWQLSPTWHNENSEDHRWQEYHLASSVTSKNRDLQQWKRFFGQFITTSILGSHYLVPTMTPTFGLIFKLDGTAKLT